MAGKGVEPNAGRLEGRLRLKTGVGEGQREYAATFIKAGPIRQADNRPSGLVIEAGALQKGAHLFDGRAVFCDHASISDYPKVHDLAGVTFGAAWNPAEGGVEGYIRLYEEGVGGWLAALIDKLLADREAGRETPDVGLSAVIWYNSREDESGRKSIHEITHVESVDVVFAPGAQGAIRRALSVIGPPPGPSGNKKVVSEKKKGGQKMYDSEKVGAGGSAGVSPDELLRAQCQATLDAHLAASSLPEPFLEPVREMFEGRTFRPAELKAELSRQSERYAKVLESQTVRGLGGPVIDGMRTPLERLQLATEQLFGLPVAGEVERLSGIRELYLLTTGDREFHGTFKPERVALANATTSTMAELVRNAMNKVVMHQYDVLGRQGYLWWEDIVHHEDFSSLQQAQWTTVGGFGDLPTVSEGNAYTELTWDDARETASWTKKGGYIGLTLEMLDRDETQKVKQIPYMLATAGIRTVSGLVAAVFTDNSGTGPVLEDTHNCFDSSNHSNLLTTALDADAWGAVCQAMFKQAELNSAKRLGIKPKFMLVPIELEKTAFAIINSDSEPGGSYNDANPYYKSAEVRIVPEWTDPTDWAAVADPAVAPGIGVGYRYGRYPEIFVAGDPLVGSMFTNDEMRLKARYLVTVGVINHRALHKNNVSDE